MLTYSVHPLLNFSFFFKFITRVQDIPMARLATECPNVVSQNSTIKQGLLTDQMIHSSNLKMGEYRSSNKKGQEEVVRKRDE